MKLWFDYCGNFTLDGDTPVQLGLHWYKHKKSHSKFKSWRGFTVQLHFFKWSFNVNFVDDFEAYDRRINYWKYRDKK